jgi:hypothetical protein
MVTMRSGKRTGPFNISLLLSNVGGGSSTQSAWQNKTLNIYLRPIGSHVYSDSGIVEFVEKTNLLTLFHVLKLETSDQALYRFIWVFKC